MIKLSKHGDYAIKSTLYIAKEGALVKIKDISKELDISESFLRRIIAKLEKSEILTTIKGRNGGVKLNKKLTQISLYDILKASEEELGMTKCTKGELCSKKGDCLTTKTFNSVQKSFNNLLKLQTLDRILQDITK